MIPLHRFSPAAALVLCAVSVRPVAAADFFASFEEDEPARAFENRVEMANRTTPFQKNVRGRSANALMESISSVTASAENGPGETAARAADDEAGTKWLAFQETGWLQYALSRSGAAVSYTLVAGDDHPERDPRDWKLLGSDDGAKWTTLDTRANQSLGGRGEAKSFPVASPHAFSRYRLEISANHGGGILQLGGWSLVPAPETNAAPSPMTTAVGSGPATGYNMKPLAGSTGMHALKYGGQHTAGGRGYALNRLFDVKIPVGKKTRLDYEIFPELTAFDLQYPSTFTALNLEFTDGTRLSNLKPLDAYGIPATATGQGAGKILYPNQWNHVRIDLGAVAAGKTIAAIQLHYDNDAATAATAFGGWLDDISIQADPPEIDGTSLVNYVDTRRGTNSSSAFSRGSNEAISCLPNGFNFLVPLTDATAQSREYSWQAGNDEKNRTRFEGLGISHQPSPWMGDRNQFSVMPVSGSGAPSGDPHRRAVTFSHARETAHPDYYGVTLDDGTRAEMTPTNRGMVMRFTFAENGGSVVLDSPTGDGDFAIDKSGGAVTGWIDHGSGFRAGQSRMFVSGKFDQSPSATGQAAGGRGLTKYAIFETKTVTLRLATSLIGLDQAAKNLALEVGDATFEKVRKEARDAWEKRLGVIRVEGAREAELVSIYGCLYRLNVYPNAQFENAGTAEKPDFEYASPVSRTAGADTATATGAKIVAGKMYVNNGFWDTYRTTWPAYSLLYPEVAAELIDGFTDQYRDGGWIARWSSPGYANIMTGTSSDVAFADAYLRGVKLPDPLATYDAALKNATTPSASQDTGRKSLAVSAFLGYTPASQGESVSWAMEGFINDFGIGNMAAALAKDPATPEERRAALREQSEYFLDRSLNYVNLFDPAIGFFQARNADGKFAVAKDQYDPTKWFGPYTETNGWNFAWHAPHDPRGLANLHGGRKKLEAKLDTFFSTPERSRGPIHEEVEARDGRYGQWGISNQVSHHVPYIYNAAGAPAKCQKIVREALQRSFAGSEIGQGYSGDEDNGEMSAWFIFNALGLYPAQTGAARLVVGSPMFPKATVALANGKSLVINAPGNNSENVYVQSLAVDGKPHSGTSIGSEIFLTGATLDYRLGPQPSAWGTAPEDALPALTTGDTVPEPMKDATAEAAAGGLAALYDNNSATEAQLDGPVTLAFDTPRTPVFYTLTAGSREADPAAWTLEGSDDGERWTVLDRREGRHFEWRRETLPFKIGKPAAFRRFRLTFEGSGVALSEIELLEK